MRPGDNPLAVLPEQLRRGTTHGQRQFVLFNIPDAPVGQGDSEEIVSEWAAGPVVNSAWTENGQVFISFSFRGRTFVGRFLADPYSQRVIVKNEFAETREFGMRPEDIPQSARVSLYMSVGSWEAIERDPNTIIGIIGLGY